VGDCSLTIKAYAGSRREVRAGRFEENCGKENLQETELKRIPTYVPMRPHSPFHCDVAPRKARTPTH
jgi:hypothetical protein